MARKTKRVRLPMATWKRLARQFDPNVLCQALDILGADGRTWSALAAFAVEKYREIETKARAQFKATWVPVLNAWGVTAFELATRHVPLRMSVVRSVRELLIETGSVSQLLELNARYNSLASETELRKLADALYITHRYDWGQWDALGSIAYSRYPGDLVTYVRDKRAEAVRDHNFDG